MTQYMVIVGSYTLNNRKMIFCNSIEECQKTIRNYVKDNLSGICSYGYDDEGDVYLLEDQIMERIGNISYSGIFNEEQELIIASGT